MARNSVKDARRQAGWLGRGSVWAAAAGLAVVATGGVALASDSPMVTGHIRACYRTGSNPSQLKVLIGAGSHCPRGSRTLTWNITGPRGPAGQKGATGARGAAGPQGVAGPQGPAGLSTGMTVTSIRRVTIDQNFNNPVTVLTGLPAKISGTYYVNASLSIHAQNGDQVACFLAPGPVLSRVQLIDPPLTEVASLSLTGAVTLAAGQSPSVKCQDTQEEADTQMLQGDLNAVLVSNSASGVSTGTTSGVSRAAAGHGAS
jgi:hypothetical protein